MLAGSTLANASRPTTNSRCSVAISALSQGSVATWITRVGDDTTKMTKRSLKIDEVTQTNARKFPWHRGARRS
jgi:hypothetical protein